MPSYPEQVSCGRYASSADRALISLRLLIGTGGTIAGCGKYFKSLESTIKIILADPEGSGLYNKVKYGVMYDNKEKEGTKRRHQVRKFRPSFDECILTKLLLVSRSTR
jgi:cysteine synthase